MLSPSSSLISNNFSSKGRRHAVDQEMPWCNIADKKVKQINAQDRETQTTSTSRVPEQHRKQVPILALGSAAAFLRQSTCLKILWWQTKNTFQHPKNFLWNGYMKSLISLLIMVGGGASCWTVGKGLKNEQVTVTVSHIGRRCGRFSEWATPNRQACGASARVLCSRAYWCCDLVI